MQLVELHDRLDEAFDAVRGLDPGAAAEAARIWYDIAARENGSVADTPGARFVATGEHGGTEQGYWSVDADSLDLPYLPDPIGVGAKVRLRLDPDLPEQELELGYPDGGGWYRARPLRLALVEGGPGAEFDPALGILTVSLPQGRTGTLRMSSLVDFDPELFGVVDWCRQELTADQADVVAQGVKRSLHWMTTPWRDLVLVHASQRPIAQPDLELDTDAVPGFQGRSVLARGRGETTAYLRGRLRFDLPSTAQLDLLAGWAETTDDPAQTYPDAQSMVHGVKRPVLALPVPEPFGTPWQPELVPLIEPLDRDAVAFATRGQEVLTPETLRVQLRQAAAAPGRSTAERRRLEGAAAQLEKLRGHEFGDTRYRRVSYTPMAATRFREYFDSQLPTDEGNATGPAVTVEVLSSAPPAKPEVLQVLPLMAYEQQLADDVTSSRREGLGLRVWLARPWFSSGAGERLAVVCDRGGPLTADSDLSREITLITADPAHASALPLPLTARSFAGAEVRDSVTLAEGTRRRDLACFEPVWDPGRQAWYVDLRFDTGTAYFPLVRLGLARYRAELPARLRALAAGAHGIRPDDAGPDTHLYSWGGRGHLVNDWARAHGSGGHRRLSRRGSERGRRQR